MQNNSSLSTEVEILKSPSVLMSVFEFVKEQKNGPSNTDTSWNYSKWLENNLSIELEAGTSILNIKYKDNDKNIIMETLSKISNSYQKYSGRDRKKRLKDGIKFVEKQIEIYKTKSAESFKKAQEFGMLNNISPIPTSDTNNKIIDIDSEKYRIEAERNLSLTEKYINEIENINNPEDIRFNFALTDLELTGMKKLEEIDSEIAQLRAIFTDNDPGIKNLLKQRAKLIENLKLQTRGMLSSRKNLFQAQVEASKRSRDDIITFKKMTRDSIRDENILTNLEAKYQELLLDSARADDPWELITKPTLDKKPISPKLLKNLIFYFLSGSLIGIILSFYKYQKDDIFFSENLITRIISQKCLFTIHKSNLDRTENYIKLLANSKFNNKKSGKINLIPIGEINNEIINNFSKLLNKHLNNFEINLKNNILEFEESTTQIFFIESNKTKKQEIFDMQNKLELLGLKLNDWVLIK